MEWNNKTEEENRDFKNRVTMKKKPGWTQEQVGPCSAHKDSGTMAGISYNLRDFNGTKGKFGDLLSRDVSCLSCCSVQLVIVQVPNSRPRCTPRLSPLSLDLVLPLVHSLNR